MSMDLRALRYFVCAVSEGSISAAALKCHVAQPSVTAAVAKLESQFDCCLLHRHRKGVSVTDRGAELHQLAVELLQHADAIESRFSTKRVPVKLTIAVDRSVRVSYVEHIISAIHTLNLAIELELCDDAEQADLRLCPKVGTAKKGTFHAIATERYALLIPNNNALAHRRTLTLQDLSEQPLIERCYCENHLLFNAVREQFDLKNPVVARVENEEWALSLVAAGLGICISPLPVGYRDPRFKVKAIDELSNMTSPKRQVGLLIKRGQSSELQVVLDQLSQHLLGSLAQQTNVQSIQA